MFKRLLIISFLFSITAIVPAKADNILLCPYEGCVYQDGICFCP